MAILHLMVGLPCSGKTTYAKKMAVEKKALLLTSHCRWNKSLTPRPNHRLGGGNSASLVGCGSPCYNVPKGGDVMLIAKNLRRLRLDKGWTQEELAARLNVTGQAVGKWERDECYPDITLLPGLAGCFGVTVDELLGIAEIKGRMWGVNARANTLQAEGRYHEAVKVYDEALEAFPADLGLAAARAEALAMAGDGIDDAIRVCERRLEEKMDDHTRSGVIAVLCFLYGSAGMTEKAETLARRRPHARDSRELLLPGFLAPAEREAYLREHLPGILTAMCGLIDGEQGSLEEQLRQTVLGRYGAPVPPAEAAAKIAGFLGG